MSCFGANMVRFVNMGRVGKNGSMSPLAGEQRCPDCGQLLKGVASVCQCGVVWCFDSGKNEYYIEGEDGDNGKETATVQEETVQEVPEESEVARKS